MIGYLKHNLRYLYGTINLMVALMMLLSSCDCNRTPPDEPFLAEKTLLVYIAGDNNLKYHIEPNLNLIQAGLDKETDKKYNVIALVHKPGGVPPYLLRVRSEKRDTICHYAKGSSSTDPSLMSMVIDDVMKRFPAESYGIVFWSHGCGWIPSTTVKYLDTNSIWRVQQQKTNTQDDDGVFDIDQSIIRDPFAETRAFGIDSKNVWLDTEDLISAIPAGVFDVAMFDACYMSSVEFLYAMRNHFDWVIASAAEIMDSGFPYDKIIRQLLEGDYVSVCQGFFNHYNEKTAEYQTATIGLIDMSQMDTLAYRFGEVWQTRNMQKFDKDSRNVDNINVLNLQRYDRYVSHVFYDMESFATSLEPADSCLREFELALSACVPYKAHTKKIVNVINVNTFSGMSAYVPFSKYDNKFNSYYFETEWFKAISTPHASEQ